MTDDQAPPNDVPAEAPPQAETPQTPVSDGLASTPTEPLSPTSSEPTAAPAVEPTSEPTPEAVAPSEPAEPVSETVPEAVAAEPLSEPEIPEPEPVPRRQEAASAAQPASAPLNTSPQAARELLVKARAKIQTKKQQKLEKIMTLFDTKEKITNDDVEKLLHVSDATALRYLKELVKQGKIKRIGTTGAGVEYTKI